MTNLKHSVTNQSIERLEKVMLSQDKYGYDKYKKELNHKDNYNWLDMFQEEIADGLKYIECERMDKEQVIQIIKEGLTSESPKTYMLEALKILTKEGTGKG